MQRIDPARNIEGKLKAVEHTVVSNVEPRKNAVPIAAPVRRAVILAAGLGSRLLPMTIDMPKCLTEINGQPILLRALRALSNQGFSDVVIVVGHNADKIRQRVGTQHYGLAINYVDAPRYKTTNNICSLWDACHFCDQDILLLEGDVVFDEDVLTQILQQAGNAAAVVPYHRELSGTVIRRGLDGHVTEFVLGADQDEHFSFEDAFKTSNIYLLRGKMLQKTFLPALSLHIERGYVNDYYETVLRDLVADQSLGDLAAVDISASRCCEVDDHQDLAAAEFQFLDRSGQFDRIQQLHGSYWRYGFVDHSYLYNMHFPTTEMLDNYREELSEIVTNYPAGQDVMTRLVANWSGADPDHLVVANGGAELIKILGEQFVKNMTLPVPSFNEYEQAATPARLNPFPLDPETFELDVDRFGDSAIRAGSNVAVVVTPNNPTALSIDRADILKLARKLEPHHCRLLVDESFIEFSRVGPMGSVESEVASHPNLVVLKSMSKVFGIAGLRLGYLLTADREFREDVRGHVPIWNINGLAEAFLRSVGNFREEFILSCELTRQTCQEFYRQLQAVPG
ncbi:MAG: L-threonine O-3-phosphate decarboxylase, partial [Actinobacteria bacterium]